MVPHPQLPAVPTPVASTPPPPRPAPRSKADIVAIDSSTGGPNALSDLFSRLSPNLPVPIVIVQHMPAVFTKHLVEQLTSESKLTVHEASDGERLGSGRAWIAPGDYHMTLSHLLAAVHVELNQGPPENSCRPSVDVLFHSMNEIYRNFVLAVMLTGVGEDGLAGAKALHASGSAILAQEEASSVVWGMAGAVSRAGIVSAQMPPSTWQRRSCASRGPDGREHPEGRFRLCPPPGQGSGRGGYR
ncbi:MAG: hypothetical protein CME19_07000 [Gemmatimonadetes bacterium]|nr:hypothetical protein [Gemmatimonadota bacterium]